MTHSPVVEVSVHFCIWYYAALPQDLWHHPINLTMVLM